MKKILLLGLFLGVSASLFARDYKVLAVETENNKAVECFGESMSVVTTENNLEISVSMTPVEDNYRVCVDIKNLSEETYTFNENHIKTYQGIYEEGDWKQTNYIPAAEYYEQAKTDARVRTVFAAVGLGLAAIDAGLAPDPFFVPSPRHSPLLHEHERSRHYSVDRPHHFADPAFVGLGLFNLFDTLDENESTLDYLDRHLLFSTKIEAKEGYSGIFLLPKDKGPDYKISMKISKTEVIDFYFTRNDKERVLHPWADSDETYFAMTFNPGIVFYKDIGVSFGMNFLWCSKELGGYFGFNYGYVEPADYNYIDIFEFSVGITDKICPHVWLMGGLGFEYDEGYSREAKNHKYDYFFSLGPEIGMNFIFNWIDFGFIVKKKLYSSTDFAMTIGFAL